MKHNKCSYCTSNWVVWHVERLIKRGGRLGSQYYCSIVRFRSQRCVVRGGWNGDVVEVFGSGNGR